MLMKKRFLSMLVLLVAVVTGAWAQEPATYKVTLQEGTEDATNWTIPAEAPAGSPVTATYNGSKKVKSVKAVVKGPVDLSKLDAPYEAQDGEVLTGTLDVANHPVKISIAEGATVTLAGVTINGVNNNSYSWAGITCEGDATIILKDGTTNTVKGFRASYPGIFVPKNKTLIIKGGAQGTGKLIASSNNFQDDGSAGIGAGYEHPCGNIEIQGGDITATGGNLSAGIGGSAEGACGNITISGGTIKATGAYLAAGIGSGWNTENGCGNITITGGTIEATGGGYAAGIGSGVDHSSCGTIIITNGVTKVTATKGSGAPYSIGAGNGSSCGTVTIGGVEGAITNSPYTYQPSN